MANESRGNAGKTHDEILAQIRGLTASIRDGAAAAEEARTLPRESIDALLSAGITRILVPPRFGGYGLGLDTWFEVVREIAKADASHAWCAGLMIHHPHYISQFAEDAQQAVWADGPDVPSQHRFCRRPASRRSTAVIASPVNFRSPAGSITAAG
jgi:alkylation response protein AidB-like acyl-CoA dehydrogenase